MGKETFTIALTRPNAAPISAEAKNMIRKRPTAEKNFSAPLILATAGFDISNTDLQYKDLRNHLGIC